PAGQRRGAGPGLERREVEALDPGLAHEAPEEVADHPRVGEEETEAGVGGGVTGVDGPLSPPLRPAGQESAPPPRGRVFRAPSPGPRPFLRLDAAVSLPRFSFPPLGFPGVAFRDTLYR